MIPEKLAYLLDDETKAQAWLALVLADGTPHVSAVWFRWDGEHIIVNTARGRVKDRVLQRTRYAAIAIGDPNDFYTFMQIRGPVVEETEQGALDEINTLSWKYFERAWPHRPGEVRVTYKIRPEKVSGHD